MFVEISREVLLMLAGALLIGCLLGSAVTRLSGGYRSGKRDPRDNRIRALEAELRVAQGDAAKIQEKLETVETQLKEAEAATQKRDKVIAHQQSRIAVLDRDLRDSVKKTRELRHELSDRAAESVRSEARLREVETELSVAQASTDLIATGVLDYSVAPDAGDAQDQEATAPPDVPKTAG